MKLPRPSIRALPATFAPETQDRRYIYPHWPWLAPVRWIRSAFIELIMRPLVRFLAKPRVIAPPDLGARVQEPILIIANHVTTYDGPLVQYALPGRIRRHIAAAMSGEMLDDFRHFRSPDAPRPLLSVRPHRLVPGDRAVQRLSAAPPARIPAQLCARRRSARPRLPRPGFS